METKWTHMMFALAGLILAWLLYKSGEWGWSYFAKPNGSILGFAAVVLASSVTYVAWRNEELFTLANEVAGELRKVTWPSRQETMHSTLIVMVTTIVASLILGMFDGMWSWFTRQLYG